MTAEIINLPWVGKGRDVVLVKDPRDQWGGYTPPTPTAKVAAEITIHNAAEEGRYFVAWCRYDKPSYEAGQYLLSIPLSFRIDVLRVIRGVRGAGTVVTRNLTGEPDEKFGLPI